MKKTRILAVVLSLCMLLALVPVAALADFTDIDEATNENYADAIERWSGEGVISGVGNDTFDPKGTMTRVQGFGIIANLLNLTEKADLSEYTDVPTDGWKADYLAKVVAAGIVTGYPDKTLRPEGELTREQMFVTIAKTLGVQPVETDDEEFEDIGEAADYAAPYINALHKMGAVNGSNGNVNPLDILNRESAALLLDNLIGGYANTEGDTVEIEKGKITLIVADNVAVTGEITEEDMPIVVAGQAGTVDMKEVTGDVAPTVNVTVSDVTINDAPVGTEITATETAENVTANGIDVSADPDKDVVVPEPEPEQSYTPPPYVDTTNYAKEAADDAWEALENLLTTRNVNELIIPGNDGNGHYTLTLNADNISATEGIGDSVLSGLMTAIKEAIDAGFSDATLKINDQVVYENGAFNHTNLKAALYNVADGFFFTLKDLSANEEGIYTYKEPISGTVEGRNNTSYPVSLAIQLKGSDVEKIKTLAGKFEKYLSMEQMTSDEIEAAYGTGTILEKVTGEDKYIVVKVTLPDTVKSVTQNIEKTTFDGMKISEAFAALKTVGKDLPIFKTEDVQSALKTVNNNAVLINKVLDKLTITINGKTVDNDFTPTGDSTEFEKFVGGVAGLFGSDEGTTIGGDKIGAYALTKEGCNYYAVPVTVTINLQDSMDFTATETIVVILDIPLKAAD